MDASGSVNGGIKATLEAFPDGSGFVVGYVITAPTGTRAKLYDASGALVTTLTDQLPTDPIAGGGTFTQRLFWSAPAIASKPDSTGFVVIVATQGPYPGGNQGQLMLTQYSRAGMMVGLPTDIAHDFITSGAPNAQQARAEDPSAVFLSNGELVSRGCHVLRSSSPPHTHGTHRRHQGTRGA